RRPCPGRRQRSWRVPESWLFPQTRHQLKIRRVRAVLQACSRWILRIGRILLAICKADKAIEVERRGKSSVTTIQWRVCLGQSIGIDRNVLPRRPVLTTLKLRADSHTSCRLLSRSDNVAPVEGGIMGPAHRAGALEKG